MPFLHLTVHASDGGFENEYHFVIIYTVRNAFLTNDSTCTENEIENEYHFVINDQGCSSSTY